MQLLLVFTSSVPVLVNRPSAFSPRHWPDLSSYYQWNRNIRVTEDCSKYPNCLWPKKATLTHLIYCKTNEISGYPLDQTHVIQSLLVMSLATIFAAQGIKNKTSCWLHNLIIDHISGWLNFCVGGGRSVYKAQFKSSLGIKLYRKLIAT